MITDRARRLLMACLRGDDSAVAAFAAWKQGLGSGDLDASELRLMPMLHANLRRLGVQDPMLARLGGMAKHVWLSGELRLRDVMVAIAELARTGIPVTALKGMALLARWPEIARTRPMGDFDILIAPDQVRAALAALEAIGWIPLASTTLLASGDLHRLHALALLFRQRSRHATSIDLHWRPSVLIEDPAHAAELMRRAEPARIGEWPVPIASLADHLFILLAHALLELRLPRRDWVAEAAVLLRSAGTELDWDLYGRLVQRYRMQAWSRTALSLVAELAGDRLPSAAIGRTGIPAPLQRREIVERHAATAGVAAAWGDAARSGRPRRIVLAARLALDPRWDRRFPRAMQLRCLLRDAAAAGMGNLAGIVDLTRQPLDGSPLAGWAFPEETGRWTDGPVAWLALALPERSPDRIPLRLHLVPYLPTPASRLTLHVWAGAAAITRQLGPDVAEEQLTLDARPHRWGGRSIVPLQLRIERPHPPASPGPASQEPRDLGVFLRRIDFALPQCQPTLGRPLCLDAPEADRAAWSGWGQAEPNGRWTLGPEARLLLHRPAGHATPGALRLEVAGVFGPPGQSGQTVDVAVDGRHVMTAALARASPPLAIEVPIAAATGSGGLLDMRLRPRWPTAPAAVGQGDDPRALGVMLRRVTWMAVGRR